MTAIISDEDRLSGTFARWPTRPVARSLPTSLRARQRVNELAAPFELTLPTISKHIKTLDRAGLVTRGHLAHYRPCALSAGPLADVATWAEQYRPVWEARLDRMDAYLTKLANTTNGRGTQ